MKVNIDIDRKKVIIGAVVIAILVGFLVFNYYSYNASVQSKYDDYTSQISKLQTDLKSAKSDSDTYLSRINALSKATQNSTNTPKSTAGASSTDSNPPDSAIPIEKGQVYETKKYKFTIIDYKFTKSIKGNFNPVKNANENAIFLVVTAKIENIGTSTFDFYSEKSDWTIIDAPNKRAFDFYGDSVGVTPDYIVGTSFAPGIPQTKTLLFEVADNSKELKITIAKSNSPAQLYYLDTKR